MTRRGDKPTGDLARAEQAIARIASSFPEVHEDNPWGHRAFKVRNKTFLFLAAGDDGLSFSVKLPDSGEAALALLFTEPTGYGLGKSGWVTAQFEANAPVPLELVEQWLEESYVAIAPKKLAATLREPKVPPSKPKTPPSKPKTPPSKPKTPPSKPKTPPSKKVPSTKRTKAATRTKRGAS